jgi:hypothetical protein
MAEPEGRKALKKRPANRTQKLRLVSLALTGKTRLIISALV